MDRVQKFVLTGSASSIIGPYPENQPHVYQDVSKWADIEDVTKPNDKAKLLAEK